MARIRLVLLVASALSVLSGGVGAIGNTAFAQDTSVNGYIRKDGTSVQPYRHT